MVSSPRVDDRRLGADVHQQERAGAVGALGVARARCSPARTAPPAGRRPRRRSGCRRAARARPASSPMRPADGRTSGSTAGGTPNSSHSSSDRNAACARSNSSVRDALRDVGDVRLAARQPPDQEAVDGAEGDLAAPRRARAGPRRCRAASDLRRREVGVEHQPGPLADRRLVPGGLRARRTAAAVRRSCQTMALPTGRPSARSHSKVVSRWLVMPMAAMRLPSTPSSASPSAPMHRGPDRLRIVLHLARAADSSGRTRGSRAPRTVRPRRRSSTVVPVVP